MTDLVAMVRLVAHLKRERSRLEESVLRGDGSATRLVKARQAREPRQRSERPPMRMRAKERP